MILASAACRLADGAVMSDNRAGWPLPLQIFFPRPITFHDSRDQLAPRRRHYPAGCARAVMLRPHREPASRIAWIAVVVALPLIGVIAYALFGEVNIGRKRIARLREVEQRVAQLASSATLDLAHRRRDSRAL